MPDPIGGFFCPDLVLGIASCGIQCPDAALDRVTPIATMGFQCVGSLVYSISSDGYQCRPAIINTPAQVNIIGSISVQDIKSGDVLRISMKPGLHLEPKVAANRQNELRVGRQPHGQRRASRGFSRTVFLGRVVFNDLSLGRFRLQVQDRDPRNHFLALVPFAAINKAELYRTPGEPGVPDVEVGAGPRAQRHVGVQALGLRDAQGFMNLVPVRF